MNKGLFFAEGLKFFDIAMKEKLAEYDAPPWSPNIDNLSPIKRVNTPFCTAFESCSVSESFNTCKLEFQTPESEESTLELSEKTEEVSQHPTPKVRKPITVIMSKIRRINFDLPEDYELQVKSATVADDSDSVNETMV